MRQSVTISIPADVRRALDSLAKKDHVTRSDLIKEAVRRYLAIRRFHEIRRTTIPKARARGIFMDEDVFKIVS